MKRTRRILHASDFSPASRAAFSRALDMARRESAELLLAHVLTPVAAFLGEGYVSPQTYDRIERSARMAAQKHLDAMVARARKAGVRAQRLLLTGTPHVEIVRAARSKGADVVVMGTHGRSGLAKLFLGSVAGRVVATAPCPVLTVRGGRSG